MSSHRPPSSAQEFPVRRSNLFLLILSLSFALLLSTSPTSAQTLNASAPSTPSASANTSPSTNLSGAPLLPGSASNPNPNQTVVGSGTGTPCDPRKSILDPLTHKFRSECGVTEWCMPDIGLGGVGAGTVAGASVGAGPGTAVTMGMGAPVASSGTAGTGTGTALPALASTVPGSKSASPSTNAPVQAGNAAFKHPLQQDAVPNQAPGAGRILSKQGGNYDPATKAASLSGSGQGDDGSTNAPPHRGIVAKVKTVGASSSGGGAGGAAAGANQGHGSSSDDGDNSADQGEEDDGGDGDDGSGDDGEGEDDEEQDGQDGSSHQGHDGSAHGGHSYGNGDDGDDDSGDDGSDEYGDGDGGDESDGSDGDYYRRALGVNGSSYTWYDPLVTRDDPPSVVSLPPSPTSAADNTPSAGHCRPKGCRRDEYPFGYKGVPQEKLPPMCGTGMYCPDEENACQPLIPLGGACQLNRDDSCANPAPNLASSAPSAGGLALPFGLGASSMNSTNTLPLNSTSAAKSICLQGVCSVADVGQGQRCLIDHTQYLGYDASGQAVADSVSRDDCRDNLYCDSKTLVCLPEKALGQPCESDRECTEFNCHNNVCDLPPEAPNRLPGWAFGLIGLGIFLIMAVTVVGLYRVHISHRALRAEEIDRYFSEQWTYRQSILSMHAAALAAGAERDLLLAPATGAMVDSRSTPLREKSEALAMGEGRRPNDESEMDDAQARASGMQTGAQGMLSPPLLRRKPAPAF